MDIKAVLFDFGGTLFDYNPSNAEDITIWKINFKTLNTNS